MEGWTNEDLSQLVVAHWDTPGYAYSVTLNQANTRAFIADYGKNNLLLYTVSICYMLYASFQNKNTNRNA